VPRGDTAGSQTTKATLGLRELIFDGELAPGQRVPEIGLAERLGVSRTPLRLALANLGHEGLLRPLPGGGFVVCSFTRSDVADAIELRGVLEGTAARFAAERLGDRELAGRPSPTARQVVAERVSGGRELNDEYHRGSSPQRRRTRRRSRTQLLCRLPRRAPLASQATLTREHEILVVAQHQHRMLLDAVGAGHGSRAEDIAREHARLAKLNLELVLESEHALERLPGAPLLRRAV
jgi:GntR family transcriptional regulator of vanillate catabolism